LKLHLRQHGQVASGEVAPVPLDLVDFLEVWRVAFRGIHRHRGGLAGFELTSAFRAGGQHQPAGLFDLSNCVEVEGRHPRLDLLDAAFGLQQLLELDFVIGHAFNVLEQLLVVVTEALPPVTVRIVEDRKLLVGIGLYEHP